jgi:two-component system OmpR family sensor kinase
LSIQKRLLLIYTAIFSAAIILIALTVYFLPRNRILAEIDRNLEALASEVRPENLGVGPGGVFRISIPEDLANFETASTFILIIDGNGNIVARSSNLSGLEGLLDPNGRQEQNQFSLVKHDQTLLRVLTAPLIDATSPDRRIVGHLQIARLLDNFESFNRLLIIALLIGFAAATASLILAVWLTPSLFKPLEDIATVAQQITRADDLSRRVPDTGRTDEIGDLTRAINQTLERLERLFRAQQRLLADVSHELRTPLTAVRGNLDLMRRMGETDSESLIIVQEEVERMTRLVGDLLLLARADAGGLPLAHQPVELDGIFLEVYRQEARLQKSIEVTVADLDQASVMGDADRLKQLLINLVDNAIKYTPSGGKVQLSLSKADGWARIDVADSGIGIPKEDLPYIFDRFYRVDRARSRTKGGSGLGLSIAKWIAKAHGGDIQATSEVGVGTTFTVTLPLRPQQSGNEVAEESESGDVRSGLSILGRGRARAEG